MAQKKKLRTPDLDDVQNQDLSKTNQSANHLTATFDFSAEKYSHNFLFSEFLFTLLEGNFNLVRKGNGTRKVLIDPTLCSCDHKTVLRVAAETLGNCQAVSFITIAYVKIGFLGTDAHTFQTQSAPNTSPVELTCWVTWTRSGELDSQWSKRLSRTNCSLCFNGFISLWSCAAQVDHLVSQTTVDRGGAAGTEGGVCARLVAIMLHSSFEHLLHSVACGDTSATADTSSSRFNK
jgi:hypothetical protein